MGVGKRKGFGWRVVDEKADHVRSWRKYQLIKDKKHKSEDVEKRENPWWLIVVSPCNEDVNFIVHYESHTLHRHLRNKAASINENLVQILSQFSFQAVLFFRLGYKSL